ncbi:MAG: TIGR04282 family arsenosugar biosynthesis glycosyltransferase [Gammaproteobacteria bacterium]
MAANVRHASSNRDPYPRACLLVFAKAPIAGRAKTRLIPKLGARGAARLHARLTRRTLTIAVQAQWASLQLCYSPARTHGFFQGCRRDFALSLQVQQGDDLGQRMHHALAIALCHYDLAILIGSDCPGLSARVLRAAFKVLRNGSDVVLVPATDGGYVLVGMRHAAARLFHGLDWGSSRVLTQTRRRLKKLQLRWTELAPLADVDRPEDIRGVARGRGGLLFDFAAQ